MLVFGMYMVSLRYIILCIKKFTMDNEQLLLQCLRVLNAPSPFALLVLANFDYWLGPQRLSIQLLLPSPTFPKVIFSHFIYFHKLNWNYVYKQISKQNQKHKETEFNPLHLISFNPYSSSLLITPYIQNSDNITLTQVLEIGMHILMKSQIRISFN